MRITGVWEDQFVGIGETTPTARLHIKGSGNDNTTTSLLVQNSDGTNSLKVDDSGLGFYVNDDEPSKLRFYSSGNIGTILGERNLVIRSAGGNALNITGSGTNGVIIGSTTPTLAANTALAVRGQGATSATTALLVQNSAGNTALEVLDNRDVKLNLGSYQFLGSGFVSFAPINVNNELRVGFGTGTTAEARLHVKGSGNDNTTTALLVQNSDGLDMLELTDDSELNLNFAGQTSNPMTLRGAGSQSHFIEGGNDLTLGYSFIKVPNSAHFAYGAANKAVGVGTSSIASSTKMHIKGGGATSATTALLVQNSAGAEAFKIQDDRKAVFSGLTQFGNNVQFLGANDTSSLNNMRFVVPGSAKSLTINKDYNLTNDASAIVDIQSTTQGFLPPRMTTTERDAITSPAAGLMVYNTTTNKAQCYNGTTWNDLF